MAELSTLARPYARAAFDFANDAKTVSDWQEYLVFSAGVMNDNDFANYIRLPNISKEEKLAAIVKVSNNSFPSDFKNFLAQLAENDRLDLLPAISTEFEIIKAQSTQELKALVESAYELTPAQVVSLEAGLQRRFGTKVHVESTVNEELIAGVIIRVGDQVIDDSARNKLQQLKNRLVS